MKWQPRTLRLYQQLHTWTGLLAGFALFIAFYAGALSVFRDDIARWQHPPPTDSPALAPTALLARAISFDPQAGDDLWISLPANPAEAIAFWPHAGQIRYLPASTTARPQPQPPAADLADFIYALHYSLGASSVGLYLMGVVSLLYGLALISGLIIQLPGLLKQLFALRPGRNLKRLWLDAHNAIGVLSLPFHIIFAWTGALFCLLPLLLPWLGRGSADPELASRYRQAIEPTAVHAAPARQAPPASIASLLQQAVTDAAPGEFQAQYLHIRHYRQPDGSLQIIGHRQGQLGSIVSLQYRLADGALLASSLGPAARLNFDVYAAMYGLHFGNYGGRSVQWLYFALGLGGAFLFYSGNLLWLESRRRRRHCDQPRRVRLMARATLGLCLGSCLGISLAFAASLGCRLLGLADAGVPSATFFTALVLACIWACLASIPTAARGLCQATAWVSLTTALLHLGSLLASAGVHRRMPNASELGVDLVGLALGLGFLGLARAVHRRARYGDPHSIWSRP